MKNDPIQQYKQLRQALIDERDQIRARLVEIEAALEDAPAPKAAKTPAKAAAPRARRARASRGGNKLSLKAAVIQVLSQKPMKRKEILEAVKKIGYTFASKTPLNSLGVVLYGKSPKFDNDKGVFSLGRGVKAAAAPKAKAKAAPKTKAKAKAKTKAKAKAKTKAKAKAKAAPKKKRKLSPEARARIVAAQKKRWAKVRSAK